jgi:hypothetical protein
LIAQAHRDDAWAAQYHLPVRRHLFALCSTLSLLLVVAVCVL